MPDRLGLQSPVGPLTIWAEDGAVTRLDWETGPDAATDSPVLEDARQQLQDYFNGDRQEFDLPLAPGGSEFQQQFYKALQAIPFGHTRTYGDLAKDLNVPAQAIGQACSGNPIPILIPCHRVLAATNLGGFSGRGGVEAKVALLKLEGAASLLI